MTTGDYKTLKKLLKKFTHAVGEFTQFAGSGGPLESRDVPDQAKEQWKKSVLSGISKVVSDQGGPKLREWIDGITFTLPLTEPVEPVPDFKQMFLLAEQYSEASDLLDEQSHRDHAVVTNYGCSGPKIMVDSFAVELYLKCLYVIDRKEAPHGHDWREIFDALKDFTRSECRATYQRDLGASPVPMLVRSGINPGAAKVLSFDEVLDAGRNTFDKRRYLYEQPATHGWFYTHFMRNAIRKIAKMDIENAKVAKALRDDSE